MKQMQLAIVRQKYRPDGGAERFISNTLKALNSSGLKLNIITREWSAEIHPNYSVHICNPRFNNRVCREQGFANATRQYWQKQHFDLIQSHERIAGCDIFRAGDGVHQAWLDQYARITPNYRRWITQKSRYHRYVLTAEREMFRSSQLKKIICNSIMVKKEIIRYYGVSEDKFVLIYNAIDTQYFKPASEKQRRIARKYFSIPDQECTLIFIGSGFRRKGLNQAIKAIATTDRYLIVVGKDKDMCHYQALAQSLGCLSRVRFTGIYQNVLSCYHAADALILPTLYDPFPNVILEAMSCGLPIITSQCCGGAEFIEHGCQGFVCDALDIPRLCEFISEISYREKNLAMGLAARKRVSICTFSKLSRQLIGLYQDLLL